MQEKIRGIIFLVTMPFIVIFFTMISILYAKDLPDPLNVMAILLLNFGPPFIMLWYWINRFYFKKFQTEKSTQIQT